MFEPRPSFSPCDSANFSSLQGSLDLHDEKALHTPRCPRRPSTRTYEAKFTMPQPSANANQQRGQDYNRVGNLSGRYSASNNAGASNGGLTQRAVHNQPKAQRDGAEPARLRMVCGDCCLPSCYVKERVKMALAQQLDVATSGECVAVLTCPPYGGPFCSPYVPAARAACPEACTRASLWRAAGGTLDGSVKLYSLLAYTYRGPQVRCGPVYLGRVPDGRSAAPRVLRQARGAVPSRVDTWSHRDECRSLSLSLSLSPTLTLTPAVSLSLSLSLTLTPAAAPGGGRHMALP